MSLNEIIGYVMIILAIGVMLFLLAMFLSSKVMDVYFKKKLKFWKDWGSEINREEKKDGEEVG